MKIYPATKICNIALMGHAGSGKTSVIEAMLLNGKVINRMGKTQDGNAVTDFDQEEQRRGSSVGISYAAMEWKDRKLNLIDTPGDFDFIADQRLGMFVADSVLLVGSSKDGLSVGAEKTLHGGQSEQTLRDSAEPRGRSERQHQKTVEEFAPPTATRSCADADHEEDYLGFVDIVNRKPLTDKDGRAKRSTSPASRTRSTPSTAS